MALPRTEQQAPRLRRLVPALAWLPEYRWSWLPKDLLAGLLGAASSIPEAMAFAAVAGLPIEAGLYVLLLPLVVYAALGSCRELAIGPTGAVSALVLFTVLPLASADPARHAQLAATLALLVAGLFVLSSILRLWMLESFVSRPVLLGFMGGAAVLVCAIQIGPLLGGRSEGRNVIEVGRTILESAGEMSWLSAAMGIGTVVAAVLLRRLHPRIPSLALAVALATLLTAILGLGDRGLATVGRVERGLPHFALPSFAPADLWHMLPGALAIFLVIYVDSLALGRAFAHRHGYRIDPAQEMRALAAINLAAGLTQGFPLGGNNADTVTVDEAGAKSPVASLFTVGTVVGTLSFGGVLIQYVPLPALSAVVLVAVFRAVDLKAPRRLWRFSRSELAFSMVALSGVLLMGLVPGLALAVFVSIVSLLLSAARPHTAQLGRVPGSPGRFGDLTAEPGREPIPGVLLYRVESSLFFANAAFVERQIIALVADRSQPTRAVVLDLESVPFVDYTGCEALGSLSRALAAAGVTLVVANPNRGVREALRRYGLAEPLRLGGGRPSIDAVLARIEPSPQPR